MKKQGFHLEHMFGSKTRARLMSLFLEQPKEQFFVRELTRCIDAQLNSVRRELKNLMDMGLILEKGTETRAAATTLADKKKYYTVNTDFILYDDLRSLFRKVQILLKQNLVDEIDAKGTISYLVFTGRFVDEKEIPTDLLIVGTIAQSALEAVIKKFETELPYEINYTLMQKDEFSDRRQVADRFLSSILNAERVVMIDRL